MLDIVNDNCGNDVSAASNRMYWATQKKKKERKKLNKWTLAQNRLICTCSTFLLFAAYYTTSNNSNRYKYIWMDGWIDCNVTRKVTFFDRLTSIVTY